MERAILKNVPRLVIDVMSLSAVEIVVDKPDAVVEIVDDITLNGSEHLFLEGLFRVLYVFSKPCLMKHLLVKSDWRD